MLTGVAHLCWVLRQSQHRAYLNGFLLIEVITISGAQEVLALVRDIFHGFEAFHRVQRFLLEVLSVGCVAVELVALRVGNLGGLFFHL
jgi:hypothetical protein